MAAAESNEKPQPRVYVIFVKENPPQQIVSTTDLVQSFLQQWEEIQNDSAWNRFIVFKDDETGEVVSAYTPYSIIAVHRGMVMKNQGEETA